MWQELNLDDFPEYPQNAEYQKLMLSEFKRLVPNFDINISQYLFKPPSVSKLQSFIYNGRFDEMFDITKCNLADFSNEFVANNRELLEVVFANMFVRIRSVRSLYFIDEITHPELINLLKKCKRLILLNKSESVTYPQWMLDLNYYVLEGKYRSELKFKILDISGDIFQGVGVTRFLIHPNIRGLNCRKICPNLICCNCNNNFMIKLSENSRRLEFDPAIITGISDTGKIRPDIDILDKVVEAYDRFMSRGNRTKRAL